MPSDPSAMWRSASIMVPGTEANPTINGSTLRRQALPRRGGLRSQGFGYHVTSTEYGVACSLPRRASPRSLRTRGKKKVCTSHRANWPNFTDSRAAHRSWAPVQPHQPQPQPRPPNQWPPPLTCHGRPPQRRWQSVDERGAPPGAAGPRPQHPRQARPKGHLTAPPQAQGAA